MGIHANTVPSIIKNALMGPLAKRVNWPKQWTINMTAQPSLRGSLHHWTGMVEWNGGLE